MVRLQPDLLQVLDHFAGEVGRTRPEALRSAFSQWAESAGFSPHHPRMREHPVMVLLPTAIMQAAIDVTGQSDVNDAINTILGDWLRNKRHKSEVRDPENNYHER